jgi:hypothetical protein
MPPARKTPTPPPEQEAGWRRGCRAARCWVLPWDGPALLPWDGPALLPWDGPALLPWDGPAWCHLGPHHGATASGTAYRAPCGRCTGVCARCRVVAVCLASVNSADDEAAVLRFRVPRALTLVRMTAEGRICALRDYMGRTCTGTRATRRAESG